jgi:hypothetical protein
MLSTFKQNTGTGAVLVFKTNVHLSCKNEGLMQKGGLSDLGALDKP